MREQLAATAPGSSEAAPHLLAKLEALEQRVDAPAADPAVEALVEQRTQQLTHDLDAVREQLTKLERTPVTDPVVASELDTLSQRLRFLDNRLNEDVATSGEVTRAVDAIGALAARVDGLAEAVATGTSDTTGPAAEELQRLVDERVEAQVAERCGAVADLTRGFEERLAAAESQPRAGGSLTGDTTGLEELLERNRMTIERLGLHLGEHDRALAELMQLAQPPEEARRARCAGRRDRGRRAGGRCQAGAGHAARDRHLQLVRAEHGRGQGAHAPGRGRRGRFAGRPREADEPARADGVVDRLAPAAAGGDGDRCGFIRRRLRAAAASRAALRGARRRVKLTFSVGTERSVRHAQALA